MEALGLFDARYLAFLETVAQLRPRLHRYCARMTGSVLDGEDVVQEALFEAYRKLDTFDDSRPLTPWLLRIAHNRCIDFLRRRRVREETEAAAAESEVVHPVDPIGPGLGRAVERLVINLPPKERACVLLKDVFDYSLDEIAGLVDSTIGGVKAALSRGRTKLAALPDTPAARHAPSPAVSELLRLYVERFNRRDWDGLRDLIRADARLHVVKCFAGRFADSEYLTHYAAAPISWRMAVGDVDGEPVVIMLSRTVGDWSPASAIRLTMTGGRIDRIVDYLDCPWVLQAASSVAVDAGSSARL